MLKMEVDGKERNIQKIAETIHGDVGFSSELQEDGSCKHDIWVPENASSGKYFVCKLTDEEDNYVELVSLQKIVTRFGGGKIIPLFKKEYSKFIADEKRKEKKIQKKFKRVSGGDKEWFLSHSQKKQREIFGI